MEETGMSRIVVVGGHGRTGQLVVGQLVVRGDTVLATIRNPKHKAAIAKLGAEAVVLDLATASLREIAAVFAGADAIVFAAGSAVGESSAIDRIGTVKTVRAAKLAGVARYVTVSAIGVSTGMSTRGFDAEMRDYYQQKRAAARYLSASGLDWTSIEPGELTDAAGTGKVTARLGRIEVGAIPRADVAAAVVAALDNPAIVGRAVQLVAGPTPIVTALGRAVG